MHFPLDRRIGTKTDVIHSVVSLDHSGAISVHLHLLASSNYDTALLRLVSACTAVLAFRQYRSTVASVSALSCTQPFRSKLRRAGLLSSVPSTAASGKCLQPAHRRVVSLGQRTSMSDILRQYVRLSSSRCGQVTLAERNCSERNEKRHGEQKRITARADGPQRGWYEPASNCTSGA